MLPLKMASLPQKPPSTASAMIARPGGKNISVMRMRQTQLIHLGDSFNRWNELREKIKLPSHQCLADLLMDRYNRSFLKFIFNPLHQVTLYTVPILSAGCFNNSFHRNPCYTNRVTRVVHNISLSFMNSTFESLIPSL